MDILQLIDDLAEKHSKERNALKQELAKFEKNATATDRVFRDLPGLLRQGDHTNAEALENVHHGLTSLREERVDETGDEQCNARRSVGHAGARVRREGTESQAHRVGWSV